MNIDYYQRQIQSLQQEVARLQTQKARAVSESAKAAQRARSAEDAASRATNLSSRRSRLGEAQRHRDTEVRHQKSVAEIERKIANVQSRHSDASKRLASAQTEAEKKRLREQRNAERAQNQKMQAISGRLAEHDRLHLTAMSELSSLRRLPIQITVLFLAANPLDQASIRLDEEARAIYETIRRSMHRDAVRFESRWALRPLDLLQALNEVNPTIVHFSGHGSDEEDIVFQDNEGNSKYVSKEALVQTLLAASGDIRLVFFNTCYSQGQAESVVHHVPAAIGMNTTIGDTAARVFSAQFYSAIGFGLSVGRAFDQALAALMLEGIPENSTPELFMAEGLASHDLVLVKPEGDRE